MASTTFINNQTVIYAEWLNDVNAWTYDGTSISGIINGTTLALQTGGLNAIVIDENQSVTIPNFNGGANGCMYENNQTITSDYTITTNKNASSVGPITIASGKAVTIPSGSRWVIL